MRGKLLEPGYEGEDLVGLLANHLYVGVFDVDFDWFELGELKNEDW